MNRKQAREMYVQNAIATASPVEMASLLLQESIKCMKKAKVSMEGSNRFEQNLHLKRAQQCIMEIVPFLNEKTKEGQSVSIVYRRINAMLVEANVKSDLVLIDEAERMVSSLYQAWQDSRKPQ
ncbi:flagellar export chaperone FliS [Domibacillus aminovorans]|uniref:Flagellar export chaperone FliS n=1 Tax=Domibacillus aminovorans TaxID=29332 RepID=A0A177L6M1_9BACI|nr:flagellar export chaperone FliS [Domibacillus aminovorans]OAH60351.1 hypothetical protein AWH49_16935 [Domibacillus aminovorans]